MTEQRIVTADCFDALRALPDKSVHCVVTSPPYLGLRDYGVVGQIGLEQSVAAHIAVLVELMREVRRVLRDDGTVWLNYGDAYASSVNGRSAADTKALSPDDRTFRDKPLDTVKASGLKPKDLMMLPARLALALKDDGWWLRSDIIWQKPNPMPESADDRPTSAHEHVFLLAKSERYFYDATAIRTPAKGRGADYKVPDGWAKEGAHSAVASSPSAQRRNARLGADKQRGHSRRHAGFNDRWDEMSVEEQMSKGANARNVWTIATEPFAGEFCTACRQYFEGRGKRRIRIEKVKADDGTTRTIRHCPCGRSDAWLSHFATFPTELARRCIVAGSPVRCCSVCAAPWERQTEKTFEPQPDVSAKKRKREKLDASRRDAGTERGTNSVKTLGFAPTCACERAEGVAATVLDPFGGAGTVALVAYRTGRNAVLSELNPDYADMARERLKRERLKGVSGSLEEWADVNRIPSVKPAAVRVRPRSEQITLPDLLQGIEAGDREPVAEPVAQPLAKPRKRKTDAAQKQKRRAPPNEQTRAQRQARGKKTDGARAHTKEIPFKPPPKKTVRPAPRGKPTEARKRERAAGKGART